MSKFLVNLEFDGYDSLEEKIITEEEFIGDQLNCSGGGVSITKLDFSTPDLVFICRKCEHNLFVNKKKIYQRFRFKGLSKLW